MKNHNDNTPRGSLLGRLCLLLLLVSQGMVQIEAQTINLTLTSGVITSYSGYQYENCNVAITWTTAMSAITVVSSDPANVSSVGVPGVSCANSSGGYTVGTYFTYSKGPPTVQFTPCTGAPYSVNPIQQPKYTGGIFITNNTGMPQNYFFIGAYPGGGSGVYPMGYVPAGGTLSVPGNGFSSGEIDNTGGVTGSAVNDDTLLYQDPTSQFNDTNNSTWAYPSLSTNSAVFSPTVTVGSNTNAQPVTDVGSTGTSNLLAAISANNNSGSSASTNGSNSTPAWTNGLTSSQFVNDEYAVQDNAMSILGSNTVAAYQQTNSSSPAYGNISAMKALVPQTALADTQNSGNASLGTIDLGHGILLTFDTATLDTYFPTIPLFRVVFVWGIVMVLIVANWKQTINGFAKVMQTPQARTAGSAFLGTNLNGTFAFICAVLIVAVGGSIPTIFVAADSTFFSVITWAGPFAGNMSLGSGSVTLGNAYDFCNHYVPMAMLITATLNHIGFRAVTDSAVSVGQAIVKFIVGV